MLTADGDAVEDKPGDSHANANLADGPQLGQNVCQHGVVRREEKRKKKDEEKRERK